ncbi:ribosomal silencing factor RsfS [Abditibacteriota bacterium]|nr:ribosomal silencing factor RsfS [Abditibacteriota bacterium]
MNTALQPQNEERIEALPKPTIDVKALEKQIAGKKAALICQSADEIKALDITILDVRDQTILTDYFIIATGTSNTHIQSIARNVLDVLRDNGIRARSDGNADSFWVVLDYGDVMLHVQSEETREFYDLERLWADAKISAWPSEVVVEEAPAKRGLFSQ